MVRQFVDVFVNQEMKVKGYGRVAYTNNTSVKIVHEFIGGTKKILLNTGKRFPTKNLLISHENNW
jgi:hypothetical protein